MKDVIIVIPDGQTNLSTVAGSYEILNSANSYWKKIGHPLMMSIRIAGFMMEQKLNTGYFSVHPIRIEDIKRADLLIIPAVFYHDNLAEENSALIGSIGQLVLKLAISRRNFDRRFIKATGNTPVEYVQRVKVEAAKIALEKGRRTILEIMYEVGYSDDKAFREVFKRVTGLSPLDYRVRYNKEAIPTDTLR